MTDEKGAWAESLCFGSGADRGWESAVPTADTQAGSTFYAHLPQPNRQTVQKGLAWVILQLRRKPEVCCEREDQIYKGF